MMCDTHCNGGLVLLSLAWMLIASVPLCCLRRFAPTTPSNLIFRPDSASTYIIGITDKTRRSLCRSFNSMSQVFVKRINELLVVRNAARLRLRVRWT